MLLCNEIQLIVSSCFADNLIDNKRVNALAKSLNQNATINIECMWVDKCLFTYDEAQAMSPLYLSANLIGGKTDNALAEFQKQITTITHLDLSCMSDLGGLYFITSR